MVLLKAPNEFLINYLQALCYSVQTVERFVSRSAKGGRRSSQVRPVISAITWLIIEIKLLQTAYDGIEIITPSREDAFPSELRQKRNNKTHFREAVENRLIVSPSRPCCPMLFDSTILHQQTII